MKLLDRLSLAWGVLTYKGGSTMERHAERELNTFFGDDPMDHKMRKDVTEIIHVFGSHHHSGFSAGIAISLLQCLLKWNPLTALTGEDDEWIEVAENMWQNRRCSRVFKERMSEPELPPRAYIIDHYIFEEANGVCYTGSRSKKSIIFPYHIDDPEYVKVDADGVPLAEEYRRKLGFVN